MTTPGARTPAAADAARRRRISARQLVTPSPARRKLTRALASPVIFVVWVGSAADHRPGRRGPVGVRRRCRGLALGHRRSSPTWPRPSPRAAARPRPPRCARPAPRPSARRLSRTDGTREEQVPGAAPAVGDLVVVEAGEVIPGDGDVVEGIATVDESAITGESAPVIRESGGDRSRRHRRHDGAVRPDRREDHHQARRDLHRPDDRAGRGRRAPEDAQRDRPQHPARDADDHLPAGRRGPAADGRLLRRPQQSLVVLVALLVCLIPTTIGALLSAIGIAGMDRLVQRNVLAMSGRAVEAAGDVTTLLLDKTGTITLGNRRAAELRARRRRRPRTSSPRPPSCPASPTRRPRAAPSSSSPARVRRRGRDPARADAGGATFVEFTAQTRMSGVDLPDGDGGPQGRRPPRSSRWAQSQGGRRRRRPARRVVDGIAALRRHPARRRAQRGRRRPPGCSA